MNSLLEEAGNVTIHFLSLSLSIKVLQILKMTGVNTWLKNPPAEVKVS